MINESNVSGFIENSDLHKKLETPLTKAKLKDEKDKIVKLQEFNLSYFRGKSHFKDDGTQLYLVAQPIYRYIKRITNRFYMSVEVIIVWWNY